uniref:Uncharacterized protein n=1 Tax=Megaviridae environmental sample TaxID=1737588 RepID=A0A5J6VIM4_9VIRU|nr:MAG: hypothetical protein [Megaviridae environmental sample]
MPNSLESSLFGASRPSIVYGHLVDPIPVSQSRGNSCLNVILVALVGVLFIMLLCRVLNISTFEGYNQSLPEPLDEPQNNDYNEFTPEKSDYKMECCSSTQWPVPGVKTNSKSGGSNIFSSTGCLCMTKEQRNILKTRGGNAESCD